MNSKIRVKEEMIGATVWIKGIGHTTIGQRHAALLAQQGRHDLLDGVVSAKKLVPVKEKKASPKVATDLSNKSKDKETD